MTTRVTSVSDSENTSFAVTETVDEHSPTLQVGVGIPTVTAMRFGRTLHIHRHVPHTRLEAVSVTVEELTEALAAVGLTVTEQTMSEDYRNTWIVLALTGGVMLSEDEWRDSTGAPPGTYPYRLRFPSGEAVQQTRGSDG